MTVIDPLSVNRQRYESQKTCHLLNCDHQDNGPSDAMIYTVPFMNMSTVGPPVTDLMTHDTILSVKLSMGKERESRSKFIKFLP